MSVLDVRRVFWCASGVEGFLRVLDRHQCVERQLRVVRTVLHVKSNQLGWVVASQDELKHVRIVGYSNEYAKHIRAFVVLNSG